MLTNRMTTFLFVVVTLFSTAVFADGEIVCHRVSHLPKKQWNVFLQRVLLRQVSPQEVCAAFQVEEQWFIELLAGEMVRLCACTSAEYAKLLSDIWEVRKDRYPEFAWKYLGLPSVRIQLAGTLGQCYPSDRRYYKYVVRMLNSSNSEWREKAVGVIGFLGGSNDIGVLSKMAMSEDQQLAWTAIWAIGNIGGERAEKALKAIEGRYMNEGNEVLLKIIRKARRQQLNR